MIIIIMIIVIILLAVCVCYYYRYCYNFIISFIIILSSVVLLLLLSLLVSGLLPSLSWGRGVRHQRELRARGARERGDQDLGRELLFVYVSLWFITSSILFVLCLFVWTWGENYCLFMFMCIHSFMLFMLFIVCLLCVYCMDLGRELSSYNIAP